MEAANGAVPDGAAGGKGGSAAAPSGKKEVKMVIVGDGGCGKTSLLMVYAKGAFPEVSREESAGTPPELPEELSSALRGFSQGGAALRARGSGREEAPVGPEGSLGAPAASWGSHDRSGLFPSTATQPWACTSVPCP